MNLYVCFGRRIRVVVATDCAGCIAGDELRNFVGHSRTSRGDAVESAVATTIAKPQNVKGLTELS